MTRDDKEVRRVAAASLFNAGVSVARVGELFDVSRTSVYRWKQKFLEEGARGLKRRIASGRPSRLNEGQRAALKQLCERGPYAAGYARDRWTTSLLAHAILRQFHVRYDPDHVGRILRQMGIECCVKKLKAKAGS